MKKIKLLLTLLCLWAGLLPALAQSVTIVKEMQKNPYANVLVMYKNDFGSFEKPNRFHTHLFVCSWRVMLTR